MGNLICPTMGKLLYIHTKNNIQKHLLFHTAFFAPHSRYIMTGHFSTSISVLTFLSLSTCLMNQKNIAFDEDAEP